MGEVVVGFALGDFFAAANGTRSGGVGDEPAGFAEQCGKGFVGSGERLGVFGIVRMQAGGGLVAAEDEGGAGGTADGGGGVGAGVAATLGSEAVEVRGFDLGEAVGGGVRGHVIGYDPDDVRRRGEACCGEEREGQKKGFEQHGYGRCLSKVVW